MKVLVTIAFACIMASSAMAPPLCLNTGYEDCGIGCGPPYGHVNTGWCTQIATGCCTYHREDWICNCTFGTGTGWSVTANYYANWTCADGRCKP